MNQVAGPGRTTTLIPGLAGARGRMGWLQPLNSSNVNPASPISDRRYRKASGRPNARSRIAQHRSPLAGLRARRFAAILVPPCVGAALARAAMTPEVVANASVRYRRRRDYNLDEVMAKRPLGQAASPLTVGISTAWPPGAIVRRYNHVSRSSARSTAGRPALHGREPGQVRKEAATAILCKCRGNGSPPPFKR